MNITIRNRFTSLVCLLSASMWITGAMAVPLSEGNIGSSIYGVERVLDGTPFGTITNSVDINNPAGASSYNYPIPDYSVITPAPSTVISGYADPGVTNYNTYDSGAYTYARNDHKAVSESRFGNSFTVVAEEGSGLVAGDPTSITIRFQMDGRSNTSGGRGSDYSSVVQTQSLFRLWSPDIQINGEGGWESPYLIDFNAYIRNEETGTADGSLSHLVDWYWNLDSWNTSSGGYELLFFDADTSSYVLGPTDVATCLPTPGNPDCSAMFDTGLLEISFDTVIGAEFSYYSWLNIIDDANGTSSGYGDFLNTMGGSASANDPGVRLSFNLAPSVVPIPGAVWLFGSGLVGLIGVARRRNALPA